MEKIDQLQTTLPVAVHDNLLLDDSKNANILSTGGLEMIEDMQDNVKTVKDKVDDLSSKMQDKVDTLSSDIRGMQDRQNVVEGKVDTIQDELKELKDMMTKLMGMIVN